MKKTAFLLLILASTTMFGQNVSDIIAQNIAARGGKDLLNKLKSYELTLVAETPMGPIEIKQYVQNGVGWKQEIQIMGQKSYTLVNRKGVYVLPPMSNNTKPTKLDPESSLAFKDNINIHGDLYSIENQTTPIDLMGEEDVNGEICYVLTIQKGGPEPKKMYISKTSGQLVKETSILMSPEGPKAIEIGFSDFKATKEGYLFPRTMTNDMGKATVKSIKINPEFDEKLFEIDNI